MNKKLHILHLEDSRNDAELIKETLAAGGIECDIVLVDNRDDFTAALERERFDLILADYNLPAFDGLSALEIASARRYAAPFLFVTGTMGEEIAVDSLKHGATDYIVKSNLARLFPAVKRALHEKEVRIARENAEQALRESEDRYRTLFNNSMDAVMLTVPDGRILSANPAACQMFGRTEEEICAIGRDGLIAPDDPGLAKLLEVRERTGRASGELTFTRKDGTRFPGEASSLLFKDSQGAPRTSMVIRDITDRKQKDEELHKLNRTLQAKSRSSLAMMRAKDEQSYLSEVCRIIVEDCGHALVWIGFANDDVNRTVSPVAHAGLEDGYLASMKITWADTERGRGPVGTAIRTGKPVVFRSTTADPRFALWREEALKRGYAAVVSIPLQDEKRTFGSLNIYSRQRDPFIEDEIFLLSDLAADLSYGIAAIRLRTAQRLAEDALRASEGKYRHLVENLGKEYFFYRHDTNGVFTYVSPSVADMLGYLPQDIAFHYRGYLTENPINREVAHHTDLSLRGIQQPPYLVEVYHKDGSARWLEVSEFPARDPSGSVVAVEGIARDITERIATEERERQASRKWQATFDAIGDAVCLLDLNGTILQCNKAMADYLGKPADRITGGNCWELIHGASGPIEACPVERMKATLQREQEELEINGKWISITVDPLMDEAGGLTGAVYILSDVSERKSMEQGLRDSLDKFRSMAEQSLVGIYIIQDGVIKYVNRTFAELFGYTVEEMINARSPRDLTVPEDWAIVEEHGRRRKAGTSLSTSYEIRGVRKDGGVIAIEIYESQALFEGRTANIGAVLDISQRKKAEEAMRDSEGKLQAITRTAQDAIILLTDAGQISYWNPAAEKMFGYGADEVLGKELLFIMPERFREAHADAFKRFAKTGEGPKLGATMEMAGLRRNGTEFPIEISITGFLLNSKRHASGIVRDITERKKLEGQLLHAQKMEAVGALAGGIAHDFNNILNVIIGYGSMVMDSMGADNPSWEHMREVIAAADRAANLTKRLLTFSRKEVVDFKHIQVNDIVAGMEKMLSRIIGEDVELRLELADQEAIVFADAGQMEQVLMNLVTNARDAMPKGGLLTISTGSMEIDDDYIAVHGYGTAGTYAFISVADTGVGMNAETQSRIFDPFYTTKGVGEGTGLGLSIAYGIIKQHKGFIQVTSEIGKGALFKILLPLSDKAVSEHIAADPAETQGGTETILIAEDEAPLRDLMRIILESFGYTVLAAEDGEEAVRMFLEHRDRVRLAIIDMIMPKKNGKDAADEMNKAQPGTRTLFVSGYSEDMIRKQGGLEEGLVFIHKPFSAKELLTKVRELLDA